MSRYQSYINTAVKIIEAYKGETPLASFLKKFLSENKKYGSRDRREISSLCYNYFRLGQAANNNAIEEKIILGKFLCDNGPTALMEYKRPEWNSQAGEPLFKKTGFIKDNFLLAEVFPFTDELSEGVDVEKFCLSFFIQPDLFLRIRPKEKSNVLKKTRRIRVARRINRRRLHSIT